MKTLTLQNPTYGQLEKDYGYWLKALNYNPATVAHAPIRLREFFYWLEQQHITDIHHMTHYTSLITNYQTYLSHRPNKTRAGGLSDNYLRIHLLDISRFSLYLTQTEQESFTTDFVYPDKSESRKTVLTTTEITQLYEAATADIYGIRDRAILAVYYGCGLRKSEGAALQLQDIKTDQGLIHVRKGKNYKQRYVPMSAGVSRDINEYIQHARPLLLNERKEQALFIGYREGKPLKAEAIAERFKQLVAQSNLSPSTSQLSLHTLRHSIATHLLQAGMKLEQISRFLGHTSLRSTQIYTHIAAQISS